MTEDLELRSLLAELVPGARIATLVPLRSGPRSRTMRADVVVQGRSQSWVVKRFVDDSTHAAAEFDSYDSLRKTSDIVPACIAIDRRHRVLVVESLPHAVDLFVALSRAKDPTTAVHALADVIARLVAATPRPKPAPGDVAATESAALAAAWPRVETWARAIGADVSNAVRESIGLVIDRYTSPDHACLTQGDPAPSNVVFTSAGQALLVDFEYGATRHALADLAQWWIRCPLPEPWFETLANRVRDSLLEAGLYTNADAFDQDLAHMASYAALYMFTWLPIEAAVTGDPAWVGAWRVRQALLSTSARGARPARSVPALVPLADWLAELNRRLHAEWPASGDGAPDWRTMVGKSP